MNWITSNVKAILSIFVTVATISYFFVVTLRDAKPEPQIIIAMVSINTTVLSYYFGSSQGMNRKDDLISTLSTGNTSTTDETSNQLK